MDIQAIKLRFGIIGNSTSLNRAIDIARQVAPTDITVLITGESGTGKEVFPKIIHQLSARKHGNYIAVNCGAIPEGTIDSELFGHEKGSFTGAHESRKGYFEVANGGTIFLDEVAELPLSTQVRLLRVLESGEFIKVGSSNPLKTNVRVVAATNVNVLENVHQGKFREDLYYRLNQVPIQMPPLRERKEDIVLLFRKFAVDCAEKYRMPSLELDIDAEEMLLNFRWEGNIRQLKNLAEQISVLENDRIITGAILEKYIPKAYKSDLPVLFSNIKNANELTDRDILYKILFEMRNDVNELKKVVYEILNYEHSTKPIDEGIANVYKDYLKEKSVSIVPIKNPNQEDDIAEQTEDIEISQDFNNKSENVTYSLEQNEIELIKRALEKNNGKKNKAAKELGISERTLYRKLKDYNLE